MAITIPDNTLVGPNTLFGPAFKVGPFDATAYLGCRLEPGHDGRHGGHVTGRRKVEDTEVQIDMEWD